jgi:putative methionine-R-sulfoxide reductase with GAF domain
MRLTRKLLIPTLIFIGLIFSGLVTYSAVISIRQFDENEKIDLERMGEIFKARLQAKEDLALALASEVANNPEIQAAFAAGDRDRLIELTLPSYQVIDAQFDFPQYQFHLPPATSFLRLHSLEQYGDDLSSFRFTVLAANAEKREVSGLEIGRGGVGVRGVVPVTYQGEHIGTVEFGANVDQTLIDELKSEFGYDLQIYLSRIPAEIATFEGATGEAQGPIAELLFQASTLETPIFASEANYQKAIKGESSIEHISSEGFEYAIFSAPLYDYSGSILGVIDIVSDHTAIAQQQNLQILLAVTILLAAMLVVGFGFAFLAGRTLRPIGELTSLASAIASGDFSRRTNVRSNDELGTLAQAFDSMTGQVQELITTLEQRVADRTKAVATSAEVSRRLSTILNRKELVIEVVEQVQQAFGYYHAHIYLFDEAKEELLMMGGTGDAGAAMLADGHKIPRGRGLVGRAAEGNQAVWVPDTSQDPAWLPNPLLPETKSEVAIPIAVGENVMGVLDVQHNVTGGLRQDDVDALQSIANQVAVALQNIVSYERAEQSLEILRVNEAQLSDALNIAKLAYWEYNAEKDLFTFNEHFYSIFHTSVEAVGGYQLSSREYAERFVYPEDAPLVGAEIAKSLASKEPYSHVQLEHRILFADGGVGHISVDVHVERDETGRVLRFYGANQDITERKNLELTALQRARQQEAINVITQKIQSAITVEEALQVAARELGQTLGKRPTLVTLDPTAVAGE